MATTAAHRAVDVAISSPVTSPRAASQENDAYYTLVFPASSDDDAPPSERVSYRDAQTTMRTVTAGGKEREAQVLAELRDAWMTKFRTPTPSAGDSISLQDFRDLVRDLVVQRLESIAGLFVHAITTQDEQTLLLGIRPSTALLCATADRLQMEVAIMNEIDPGPTYWAADPARNATEEYVWTKEAAQEELYRLFLAGKIAAEDAQIFDQVDDRENARMWSRRLHALRRFCDPEVAKIVEDTRASETIRLAFKNRPSLRYLYRQIDGASDSAPFRVVDRIRLTKAIIDAEFDCDALVDKGLLTHHLCTHTHHTDAVDTSIDVLRAQWGNLDSPWRLYQQRVLRFTQLWWFQPILHVRNYFGEELALYFAYTSFYARNLQRLCFLAAIVAALQIWQVVTTHTAYLVAAFALCDTIFIAVFVRKWEMKEREYASQWGVAELKNQQTVRPQFRGHLQLSPITHRLEVFYSPTKRMFKRLTSGALLLAVCSACIMMDVVILTNASVNALMLTSMLHLRASFVSMALLAKALSAPLGSLCMQLNDWENYKTQQEHDLNLTLKFALVQAVNSFGMLWLMTFIRPFLAAADCSSAAVRSDCLGQAADLLVTVLALDLALSIWDLRDSCTAFVSALFSRHDGATTSTSCTSERPLLLGKADATSRSSSSSSPPPPAPSPIDAELASEPYEGVLFDYAQVIISFGFIVWFAALAPLATFLAWGIAVVQIRVDAFKLCDLTQRPFPQESNSIGSWLLYLRFLSFGAWAHNGMLAVLTMALAQAPDAAASTLEQLSSVLLLRPDSSAAALQTELRVLAVLGIFAATWLLAGVRDPADDAVSKRVRLAKTRQQFLERKYIQNAAQSGASIREQLPPGRVFLNGIHAYIATGNEAEEDAAEELLDERLRLQTRAMELERQIGELRAASAPVGILVVEIGAINILPIMDALAKSADPFLQLQLWAEQNEDVADVEPEARCKSMNTSVLKKNRMPRWTEKFEFALGALTDVVRVTVLDWERLGKNRRMGGTELLVADVLAVTHADEDEGDSKRGGKRAGDGAARPISPRVRLAPFELLLDVPDALLSGMQRDLVKHGHPTLSLQAGVQLDPLGLLLLEQTKLQRGMQRLRAKEAQFLEWKG